MKNYIALTKPGIIFGNAVTAFAGFSLAVEGTYLLLAFTLLGLSCIIASACTFNNIIDREIDRKMTRTKNRPLVLGTISIQNAFIFGVILGLFGISILFLYTNLLTLLCALIGFAVYVGIYSFMKPYSVYGTVVGSIAGGMPPVVGYCAVTNQFDLGAFLLFLIVSLWQMPHFYAIALYRLTDYKEAAIPVLPIYKGIYATKIEMFLYILAFTFSTTLLTYYGYTSPLFLLCLTVVGLRWLYLSYQGFRSTETTLWAKKMFRFSLIAIMVFSFMIPLI